MRINRHVQERTVAMTRARLAIITAVDKELHENPLTDWELAHVYTYLANDHVQRATMREHREESSETG